MRIYKSNEVDDQRFYKIPKSLFGNEHYKGLSLESKMLYSFLRDRMELSKTNGWVNDNGEIYLIFSRENISLLLETSLPTVTKSFKQLIKYELIFEKRQGLGRPNLIFVCHIELSQENQQTENILLSGYKENSHSDINKICTNDTNRINTNNKNTDNKNKASFLQNDGCGYVDNLTDDSRLIYNYFMRSYIANKKECHPTINKKAVDKLNNLIEVGTIDDPDTGKDLMFDIDDLYTLIDKYFKTDYPLRDGGYADHRIYHFLSDMVLKNLYYQCGLL